MSGAYRSPGRYCLAAALLASALTLAAPPAFCQYSEPALGRLFTAPDERMRLDRDRTRAPTAAPQTTVSDVTPPAMAVPESVPPPPAPMRLTGVVRRSSDGRATVWIDDEPHETTLGRYRAGSAIPVDTPGGRVLVKPGQNIGPDNGASPR